MTDTLAQSRAWATVSVPSAGVPNIVTIATLTKQVSEKEYFQPFQTKCTLTQKMISDSVSHGFIPQTRLMLASADGYFYIYNIPDQVKGLSSPPGKRQCNLIQICPTSLLIMGMVGSFWLP